MKRLPIPSQETLREWLHYDADSGLFTWAKNRSNVKRGSVAGARTGAGYIIVRLLGKAYYAHRIAWVWTHGGNIDAAEIDHIDLNKSNNAIGNLRIASHSQQGQNTRAKAWSKSGLKGAFVDSNCPGKPWRSEIRVQGRSLSLGNFATAEEAHAAYVAASQKYFGEFARAE